MSEPTEPGPLEYIVLGLTLGAALAAAFYYLLSGPPFTDETGTPIDPTAVEAPR